MFIGHLPAGYIFSKLLFPYLGHRHSTAKAFLWAGMLGSIAPDFDIFYFYLIDQRQHNHHTYFTHFPIVWAGLLLVSIVWRYCLPKSGLGTLATVFSLNGLIHMCLDTIVGRIWWLAPFIDQPFWLFTVPALYKPWWLNFVFHWSFFLEIAIVWVAALLLHRNCAWKSAPCIGKSNQP